MACTQIDTYDGWMWHRYTQAACILGLIADRPVGAPLQLTPYGHAFVRYDMQGQHRALRHLMLRTEPMRSVVAVLIDHDGQNLDAIGVLLQEMAPLAPSTARRRARTVVSWLCDVGLARFTDAIVIYSGPQLALYTGWRTRPSLSRVEPGSISKRSPLGHK